MSLKMRNPIKVLIFSPRSITCSRAGGAEIYIHEILSRIALKECRIFVVSSSDRSDRNVHYGHLSYMENLVSKNEFLFVLFSIKYAKLIKYFDVVIENDSKFPIIWPLLLSKALSKPFIVIVYHIHGKTLFKELPYPIALMLYIYELLSLKLYSALRAFVITISVSTKRELLRLGFSEDRILVVSCGLNLKLRNLCSVAKSKKPLVVYVGRVKRYKRLDHLIKSIKMVKQRVPDIECIIAGKGDEKVYRELRNLSERLGLEAIIRFEGEVSEERKFKILKKAWVYVIPSMKEGFSISALEAQALGIPVVGYKVAGLVDCVENGVTGLIVSDGDYKALAKAIIRLLLNDELRLEMSRNAIQRALSFSWDHSADRFLEFMLQVTGNSLNENY
ncbi:MAG: hypothetical protein DRN04_13975 [Thermoprotei archaeon]|nr:MAG: hypothetical protein DRN04_13975 [Thermoprotei archaeon]